MSSSIATPSLPAAIPTASGDVAVCPTKDGERAVPPYVALARRLLAERSGKPDVEAMRELGRLLPYSDGVPMETYWHVCAMGLLCEIVYHILRDRRDFYAAGNMFVYYSLQQICNEDFLGPDFFLVLGGVEREKERESWKVWDEGGRYPDLVVELLSPSTANRDLTEKKRLYEQIWRTSEYFCHDPKTAQLRGWTLQGQHYQEKTANEHGWLWCEQLHLWLGTWDGDYNGTRGKFIRFYDNNKQVVLRDNEALIERALAAEREVARLQALLAQTGQKPD